MSSYQPLSRIEGRYEIAGPPLVGGMGLVYICFDHEEGRPVALKTFKSEYLPDRTARIRFLQEGETWLQLGNHPHIVQAYGVENVGNGREVYLVLELVPKVDGYPNASLRPWLQKGRPLSIEPAFLFAVQIARGMNHATRMIPGLVHRDLKPENILVGTDRLKPTSVQRIRVTDFGLATLLQFAGQTNQKNVSGHNNLTFTPTQLTNGWVGTPLYMPPEQWAREPLDPRTDIYAFGCILYEMFSGQLAATGKNFRELELAHRTDRTQKLTAQLPSEIAELIQRCLRPQREKRWNDWEELTEALTQAFRKVVGKDVPHEPEGGQESIPGQVKKGWSYVALGIAYLEIGKSDSAMTNFEQVIQMGQEAHDQDLKNAGILSRGLVLLGRGEAYLAIEIFNQSLNIAREMGNSYAEALALGNLGRAYQNLSAGYQAIQYHEQAINLMMTTSNSWGVTTALANLGVAYQSLGDIHRAIEYFERGLSFVQEIDDPHGESQLLLYVGTAYFHQGQIDRALKYLNRSLEITQAIADRPGEAQSLNGLGFVYLHTGKPQRAIEFFKSAYQIACEIRDRRLECAALANTGFAHNASHDARGAIKYLEPALELAREIHDRDGEGQILGNLGISHRILKDFSKAIDCYEQRLGIARETGNLNGLATSLANLANVYNELGKVSEALKCYQQSLEADPQNNNLLGAATTHLNYAELLFRQGQSTEALQHAEFALQVFEKTNQSQQIQQARGLIAHYRGFRC